MSMMRQSSLRFQAAVALAFLGWSVSADHPCTAEVASACPERPAAELADCLKSPEEHESETTISSECTDFIALNKACADDIAKSCEEEIFSEDTVLCLTKWIEPEALSEKCSKTLTWAVPGFGEDEEDAKGYDDLGMTEEDRQEKEEWQKKRRANREAAIEQMKMKEIDKKKEEERRELEDFKNENPEAYAEMIQQQEEEKRQHAAQKRRERQIAAALERKRKEESGETDDETASPAKGEKKASKGDSVLGVWLRSFGFLAVFLITGAVGFYLFGGNKKKGGGGGKTSGKKKRG